MIALDTIVKVFAVDVRDVIKMRVIAGVYFANDLAIGGGLVGAYRHRPMQSYPIDGFVQKRPSRLLHRGGRSA